MCTGGGNKPKAPEPPKPPPPPPEPLKNADGEMQYARDDSRRRAAAVAGLRGTNTTGGALGSAVTTGGSLLGR